MISLVDESLGVDNMTMPLVRYLQKLDNPPFYYAGKELHTVEYDRGWIEYLNETSDIYYTSGLTQQQYQRFLPNALLYILNAYNLTDHAVMGLLVNLLIERLENPFTMPLFSDLRHGNIFSCGTSRFTASVLCGVDFGEIPVVFQVDKNYNDYRLENAQRISSTDQINQLAKLNDKQFNLLFSQTSTPHVLSSIVRNTVYDRSPDHQNFVDYGKFVFNFWNKFITNKQININISCSELIRPLIKYQQDLWNVTFSNLENNSFNFGEILGKFTQDAPGQLNLYVYDIKESLCLEYLIPWARARSVWYHTLNKKVHLFDTTCGPKSAQWPIVAMGNFVK